MSKCTSLSSNSKVGTPLKVDGGAKEIYMIHAIIIKDFQ